MKPWLALLTTVGLVFFCAVFTAISSYDAFTPMILVTALWAAVDSSKIALQKYRSGISYGPVVIFFAVAFLWIAGFPWYLIVRYKIKQGTAVLKDDLPAAVKAMHD